MAEEYKNGIDNNEVKRLENDLEKLMQWLSNSSELRFFLQQNITQYLMDPSVSLDKEDEHLKDVEDKVQSLLTEVILHTVQSIIFYSTRLLYSNLVKSISFKNIDIEKNDISNTDNRANNDYADNDDEEDFRSIIDLFQKILKMSEKNIIHPDILHQIFEFLFFFTNATVLNEIFKKSKCFLLQWYCKISFVFFFQIKNLHGILV